VSWQNTPQIEQLIPNALILLYHPTVKKFYFDQVATGSRYWWGLGTLAALAREETTLLCRNQLPATQTV
jgi:hypothetical protein